MLFKWIFFLLFVERISGQTGIFHPTTFTQGSCAGSFYWTIWFDTNDPTSAQGDFEITSHIQQLFPNFMCTSPIGVEAQTSFDTDPTKTGDVIRLTLKEGFMCLNQQVTAYKTRPCSDYKVRYCCPNV